MSDSENNSRELRIQQAVQHIRSGEMSLKDASLRYGIAKSTLHDHLSNKSKKFKRGRSKAFSDGDEKIIAAELLNFQARTKKELSVDEAIQVVRAIIQTLGLQNNFHKEHQAGRKWFTTFSARYSLDLTKPVSRHKSLPAKKRYLKYYDDASNGENISLPAKKNYMQYYSSCKLS